MRVQAFASQKGGSGKTTLTGHLAVQAERAGRGPVGLIDIDPQGSLSDWWNERTAEEPAFAQTTVLRLPAHLDILRQQGLKLATIDTPPALTMTIQGVSRVADLIVAPTRPSAPDFCRIRRAEARYRADCGDEDSCIESGRSACRAGELVQNEEREGSLDAPPRSDRHLRLRLAAAVTGQSPQRRVTQGLDAFLQSLPGGGRARRAAAPAQAYSLEQGFSR